MPPTLDDSDETLRLLDQLADGHLDAFARLFERHRTLVQRAVQKRLDPKLLPRADSSDVLQETQIEALKRLDDYLARRSMPFRLWLLKTAYKQIRQAERRHLKAAKRAVDRQLPLPEHSTLRLAAIGGETPSGVLQRHEAARRVRAALAKLSERDREIVMLRNFDQLTNSEVACLFEITPDAARKRYRRALMRLQDLLDDESREQPH